MWWYGYGQAFTDQMEGFVNMQFDRNIAGRLVGAIRAAGVLLRREDYERFFRGTLHNLVINSKRFV